MCNLETYTPSVLDHDCGLHALHQVSWAVVQQLTITRIMLPYQTQKVASKPGGSGALEALEALEPLEPLKALEALGSGTS